MINSEIDSKNFSSNKDLVDKIARKLAIKANENSNNK